MGFVWKDDKVGLKFKSELKPFLRIDREYLSHNASELIRRGKV